MNALYSDLAERHEAFCGAFKDASKEMRKEQFAKLTKNGKGAFCTSARRPAKTR